jgi:hypothetical protein
MYVETIQDKKYLLIIYYSLDGRETPTVVMGYANMFYKNWRQGKWNLELNISTKAEVKSGKITKVEERSNKKSTNQCFAIESCDWIWIRVLLIIIINVHT